MLCTIQRLKTFLMLRSQIDILNQDFRRRNNDASNTPAVFSKDDIKIQFYLACLDPSGDATTGITRTSTTQTTFTGPNSTGPCPGRPTGVELLKEASKGHVAWNPNRYLNIWVADLPPGDIGYAQFPIELQSRFNY